jgi:DNA invertase Pin-like site-specific DNA recombinase
MAKKTLPTKPKTIGYLRVSTGAQDLDKNKADILRLANQEDLGRVQFVEEKVSGKVGVASILSGKEDSNRERL